MDFYRYFKVVGKYFLHFFAFLRIQSKYFNAIFAYHNALNFFKSVGWQKQRNISKSRVGEYFVFHVKAPSISFTLKFSNFPRSFTILFRCVLKRLMSVTQSDRQSVRGIIGARYIVHIQHNPHHFLNLPLCGFSVACN